jgi:hypothetical protein
MFLPDVLEHYRDFLDLNLLRPNFSFIEKCSPIKALFRAEPSRAMDFELTMFPEFELEFDKIFLKCAVSGLDQIIRAPAQTAPLVFEEIPSFEVPECDFLDLLNHPSCIRIHSRLQVMSDILSLRELVIHRFASRFIDFMFVSPIIIESEVSGLTSIPLPICDDSDDETSDSSDSTESYDFSSYRPPLDRSELLGWAEPFIDNIIKYFLMNSVSSSMNAISKLYPLTMQRPR